ncbi:uncharacterized protein BDZ99DRAFT_527302 [Mytilinidion resinicola]|uniref:Uncharacterized protein n=1 Tax=Mytilinidion resinicola TaxID=574789 RepID=A0A6A6Y460_9PEZI|nr:uncharacterized protein BDZ99DRAFT_527302 [Mytilinidion resinicola]KAF2802577.1 hypothetical protein BDZ99DRAFT_527302 [Mytilinidion resinicola]
MSNISYPPYLNDSPGIQYLDELENVWRVNNMFAPWNDPTTTHLMLHDSAALPYKPQPRCNPGLSALQAGIITFGFFVFSVSVLAVTVYYRPWWGIQKGDTSANHASHVQPDDDVEEESGHQVPTYTEEARDGNVSVGGIPGAMEEDGPTEEHANLIAAQEGKQAVQAIIAAMADGEAKSALKQIASAFESNISAMGQQFQGKLEAVEQQHKDDKEAWEKELATLKQGLKNQTEATEAHEKGVSLYVEQGLKLVDALAKMNRQLHRRQRQASSRGRLPTTHLGSNPGANTRCLSFTEEYLPKVVDKRIGELEDKEFLTLLRLVRETTKRETTKHVNDLEKTSSTLPTSASSASSSSGARVSPPTSRLDDYSEMDEDSLIALAIRQSLLDA